MIAREQAARLAQDHVGSPWIVGEPMRNERFGVWQVGFVDSATPGMPLAGGSLVVTDEGDVHDVGSAPGLLDDLMIALGRWPGAYPEADD